MGQPQCPSLLLETVDVEGNELLGMVGLKVTLFSLDSGDILPAERAEGLAAAWHSNCARPWNSWWLTNWALKPSCSPNAAARNLYETKLGYQLQGPAPHDAVLRAHSETGECVPTAGEASLILYKQLNQ